jgi:hypothetical protein
MKLLYNTVTEETFDYPRTDGADIQGLEAPFVSLQVIESEKPSFDSLTQYLVKTDSVDLAAGTLSREWSVVSLPPRVMLAEEWLEFKGIGGNRQPTLLYLRQSLTAASKESPLLNSLEQYLQQILALYATDPSPRSDWPLPPTTFEAAVQEAVQQLGT